METQAASKGIRMSALPQARHRHSHVGGVGLQAADNEGDGGGESVRHLGWHGTGGLGTRDDVIHEAQHRL